LLIFKSISLFIYFLTLPTYHWYTKVEGKDLSIIIQYLSFNFLILEYTKNLDALKIKKWKRGGKFLFRISLNSLVGSFSFKYFILFFFKIITKKFHLSCFSASIYSFKDYNHIIF
jgi:hypothetical protein